MIASSVVIAVGTIANVLFPPAIVLTAAMLGGLAQASAPEPRVVYVTTRYRP
ncbi:hypothetical protein IQ268_09045 [Oculatella sp. LEGE 06141]|uniref:hypothetical protein n=1 Tax=Oculatella sp. LEGE 06141 TaxID=1828648 RepID=UPI00187EF33D|nr:hypothetical protein [Oculatella sp. LEGE 06141]MBE9178705.1 hypothetical protein [Oculatella sp. LEGE 06141]